MSKGAYVSKREFTEYWLKSAREDWKVARHLFEKGDYSYALFFGHLVIEKTLKAIYADKFDDTPPYTHRLVYLAEKISLELNPEQLELLEVVTDFNLEARYPDEKFSFKKRCTEEFTQKYLKKIDEIRKWLVKKIQQKK